MQRVGVMAVVEGLSSFVGDIGKMNSAMDSLKPQGNMLTSLFAGVGNALSSFGREILNVAEVALGALLAKAIEFVIGKLRELISATIEAGAEFQAMRIRLQNLNFNTAFASTKDFTRATDLATAATKEQFVWLQKLAVTTPYDAQDIANTFTLARSYNFAAKGAKALTQDISNFAAGMGLGSTEIKRIIVNFGQMQQQGKVTQRELNDLARGAFVPVNEVMTRMRGITNLTTEELEMFGGKTTKVSRFLAAFHRIVQEKYSGASEDMAKTFSGASANLQDFVKSIFGFNVAMPILDLLGTKIAGFITGVTQGNVFNRLQASAGLLGQSITGVIKSVLELFDIGRQPLTLFDDLEGGLKHDESGGGIGDKIVEGLSKVRVWIDTNKDKIVGFFQSIKDKIPEVKEFLAGLVTKFNEWKDWFVLNRPAIETFFNNIGIFIQTKVVPFVMKLVGVFQQIADWVAQHGPLLNTFFTALGNIVATVFENLTGLDMGGGTQDFIQLLEGFLLYIIENQETIAEFITNLLRLAAVFTVIGFVLGILMSIFTAIITPIIAVVSVIAGLFAIITLLANPITWLIILIGVLVVMLLANFQYVKDGFNALGEGLIEVWNNILEAIGGFLVGLWESITTWLADMYVAWGDGWNALGEGLIEVWNNIITAIGEFIVGIADAFLDFDWSGLGSDLMQGLADGITAGISWVVDAARAAAEAIAASIQNAMGIQSPSKLFAKFGKYTMQGFAQGITENAKLAEAAMMGAVGQITAPALNMPAITQQYAMATGPSVNNQNSYTNNYNLTVNSSANTEPILQDYSMLKSLGGI